MANPDKKAAAHFPPLPPRGRGQAEGGARFAYDGLDRVIHERARLSILTSLATRPGGVLFTDLKELCALTDGNLSRHLQVLHEAGLVEVWKGVQNGRPQTLCRLTEEGRVRFLEYLTVLESVVADAMSAAKPVPTAENLLSKGWLPV
jgi:DNA-binding MarR family transcriptional regulator